MDNSKCLSSIVYMIGQDLVLLNNQEVHIIHAFLPQRTKKFVQIIGWIL